MIADQVPDKKVLDRKREILELKEKDVQRIIDMKISPINVSVHTTNPELRVKMMGKVRWSELWKKYKFVLLVVLVGVGVFFANRGKPASSGSSGSGGGTQSAASDDSGSAAADDSGTSAPSDDSGSASGSSGSAAASDEDFVRDALHDFSLEMKVHAPGTTVAFSLEGSSVTLGLLADQSQFTDDEIVGIANEVLDGTGARDFLEDGGFEISFHLFLYDDDQQMKNLQNEMMDLGFLWVEE